MRFGQQTSIRPTASPTPPPESNIVEAEQTSSLVGTALTLGGAYGLYLLGVQSTAITTLGAIATAGSVLYKLGIFGGAKEPTK